MNAKKPTPKSKRIKSKVTLRSSKPGVIKLQGSALWIFVGGDSEGSSQRFDIQQAILRDGGNELVIDCDCALPGDQSYIYTITLRRESPLLYGGEWTAGKAADRSTDICSSRVYSNGQRLALIGVWHEDGGTQQWLAELWPADSE